MTDNKREMRFDDLVDKVMMLEQEQSSIAQIQRQQMATLARLSDLNTFIGGYPELIGELQESQTIIMNRCEAMNQKLDSLLMTING